MKRFKVALTIFYLLTGTGGAVATTAIHFKFDQYFYRCKDGTLIPVPAPDPTRCEFVANETCVEDENGVRVITGIFMDC